MSMKSTYLVQKRVFDFLVSGAGLFSLTPALLLISAAVKLSSKGPVFFKQERVGLGGKPFSLLKFRSMAVCTDGPLVTAKGDRRVTSVGRVLRKYKLDELPQLFNVLQGHMSLVGPRPEVERFVSLFPEDYQEILSVRPGLTDYAAIEYCDEEAILEKSDEPEKAYAEKVLPEKIRLYHKYLQDMSLQTDLLLIARTIAAIVR